MVLNLCASGRRGKLNALLFSHKLYRECDGDGDGDVGHRTI
jgi:hypothetical protein